MGKTKKWPDDVVFRLLSWDEVTPELFTDFERRQVVNDCYRREGCRWVIRTEPFIDDWTEADHLRIAQDLRQTLLCGGWAAGAFAAGVLKGFGSVTADAFGNNVRYLDLSHLHVSADRRGRGIGGQLLSMAADWARGRADCLYISSQSSIETQAFYRGHGCVDAREPSAAHVAEEPFDCQLELPL